MLGQARDNPPLPEQVLVPALYCSCPARRLRQGGQPLVLQPSDPQQVWWQTVSLHPALEKHVWPGVHHGVLRTAELHVPQL